eukprot:Rhum_TRINITY_DN11688_c0_g1::Rhum_TRINITY_DN11688_c0_g1_i1::g.46185::m.46185
MLGADDDNAELAQVVQQLWENTSAARQRTDSELGDAAAAAAAGGGGDGEDQAATLVRLAHILEAHPDLFEQDAAKEGAADKTRGASLYRKGQKWLQARDGKVDRIRQEEEEKEIRAVTGHPSINRSSKAAIRKLADDGAWPDLVDRMTLHFAVQAQKRTRTAAWQDMHSVLADTHPHAPEITGKALALDRQGQAGERLYRLHKKAQQEKKRAYPFGDPSTSWTHEELRAYAKEHPDELEKIKQVVPGGQLSDTSRYLSEQVTKKTGLSHWERLTGAHQYQGRRSAAADEAAGLNVTPAPGDTSLPGEEKPGLVLSKRSRELAEERLKRGGADPSLWARLAKPIQPPSQPPRKNQVPHINKHTAVAGEDLKDRVTRDVHERLFQDHEHTKKAKEVMRKLQEEKQDTPRRITQEKLRQRTSKIDCGTADVFKRNKAWAADVMRRREFFARLREGEEASYTFKPDLNKSTYSREIRDAKAKAVASTPQKSAPTTPRRPLSEGPAQGSLYSAVASPPQPPQPARQSQAAASVQSPVSPARSALRSPATCATTSPPQSPQSFAGADVSSASNMLSQFLSRRASLQHGGDVLSTSDASEGVEAVAAAAVATAAAAAASADGSPTSPSPLGDTFGLGFEFADLVPVVEEEVERRARQQQLGPDNTEHAKHVASNLLKQLDGEYPRPVPLPAAVVPVAVAGAEAEASAASAAAAAVGVSPPTAPVSIARSIRTPSATPEAPRSPSAMRQVQEVLQQQQTHVQQQQQQQQQQNLYQQQQLPPPPSQQQQQQQQ